MASELSTSIGEVEAFPPEKTIAFAQSAVRWLNQKRGAPSDG